MAETITAEDVEVDEQPPSPPSPEEILQDVLQEQEVLEEVARNTAVPATTALAAAESAANAVAAAADRFASCTAGASAPTASNAAPDGRTTAQTFVSSTSTVGHTASTYIAPTPTSSIQGIIGDTLFTNTIITPSTPVDIAAKAQVGTTLKVGSFSFVVPSQPIIVSIVQTALYKEEDCPKQGSEDRRKLIVSFISYQGAKYELISTSAKDPAEIYRS